MGALIFAIIIIFKLIITSIGLRKDGCSCIQTTIETVHRSSQLIESMTVAVNGFGDGDGLQCDDAVEVAVVAVVLGDVEAAEHRAEGSLRDGAEQGGTAALELGHQLRG